MRRKLIFLVCFVSVLGLVNGASALTKWTGGGDGTSWYDANNWDPCVPGPTAEVDINCVAPSGPIIDCDIETGAIFGPAHEHATNCTQVMDVIGAAVKINGIWRFAEGVEEDDEVVGNGFGTINIIDSDVAVGSDWRWADISGDYGIANVIGSTVTCPRLKIGDNGGGELNITGGSTVTVGGEFDLHGEESITVSIDEGLLKVGRFDPGSTKVKINLDAGTFECATLDEDRAYVMDINEGVWIIDGNVVADIESDIDDGYITVYNDNPAYDVNVVYDPCEDKTIVTAWGPQFTAWDPYPDNFAKNICPGLTLHWKPGDFCVHDHNVYFGTSLSHVNGGAEPCLPHHDANTFTPTLEMGTTYYWRVDEVNDSCDTSPWKGKVWRFTTNDGNAFDPYPAHGQTTVPLNPTLHWTPGCLAASHDVYFGTDYDEVSAAEGASEPNVYYEDLGDVNNYDACTPDYLTYYYWRVDEANGLTNWRGKVWKFRSQSAIIDPSMLLWYQFNETEGMVANDSSGYERHGSVVGTTSVEWEPNEGGCRPDGALGFTTEEAVVVPVDTLSAINKAITVSVWVNRAADPVSDDEVIFDAGDGEGGDYKLTGLVPNSTGYVYWRAGNDSCDVLVWKDAKPTAWAGDWHHFAFVKDENADMMSIYFDGLAVKSRSNVSTSLTNVKDKAFNIGAYNTENSGNHESMVDDFMVYDCALSPTEIAGLFRCGDIECAWAPSPYDGEPEAQYNTALSWQAGEYAASHDVYFGTNWDDVNDANSTNHPNVDYNNVSGTSYDPGLLELGQTYYWRVDEINDACDPNGWRCKIWRFTVAEYITIDDMESYTEISEGWWYGADTSSGGELFLQTVPPVRGEQSMKFMYYNLGPDWGMGFFSEAATKYLEPNDWTGFDLKRLSLWFYGDSDNATSGVEQMYVLLEDYDGNTAEVRYGDGEDEDVNDITIEDWQEWTILLSSLNDANLADLYYLAIGFGERWDPFAGGWGYVYFDDIRLYPAMCVPERLKPAADLNYDCTVDFGDVEIMADEWLEADVNLGQVQAPKDANLVGWWKLDEGTGSVTDDSSSYNHIGVIEIIDVNVSWTTAGYDGNALEFDGGRVRVQDTAALRPMDQVSACAWIYYSEGQSAARVVVKGPDNRECYEIEISDDDYLVFHVRDGNDPNADSYPRYAAESNDNTLDRDEWIHVAGTYDGNSVRCYINGELAAVNHDANTNTIKFLSQDTNDLAIGNRSDDDDRAFIGKIDDVRIYNYALSAEEIAYIATNGIKIFTVQSVANLYNEEDLGKRAVNFRDFAVIADGWLEKKLWPE